MKKIIVYCEAVECFSNSGGLASTCIRGEIHLVSKNDILDYHKGEELECIDYEPKPACYAQEEALESNQGIAEKRCEGL